MSGTTTDGKFSRADLADLMQNYQSLGGLPASPKLIKVYTSRLHHLAAVNALQHTDEPDEFLKVLQSGEKVLAPSTILTYLKSVMAFIDVLSRGNRWDSYFAGDRETTLRQYRELTTRLNRELKNSHRQPSSMTAPDA